MELQDRNSSKVVWGAADGKMLPDTAELQDWHIWGGLLIAGLTLSAVAGLAVLRGHRGAAPLAESPGWAPVGPCGAALKCCCLSSLRARSDAPNFLVSISLVIFNSRICSLPVAGWSLTMLDV